MKPVRFCERCSAEIPKHRRACPSCGVRYVPREKMATVVLLGFGELRSRSHRAAGQRSKLGGLE